MPGSSATKWKPITYILLLSLTARAYKASTHLVNKSWYPSPTTLSTTIMEEFFPFLGNLGPAAIPTDDNIVKILVFLLHFHLTLGCLGVWILGTLVLLEMGVLSLWEMWRRGGIRGLRGRVWVRNPLDLIHPEKRTLFEQIVLAVFWVMFYVWIQLFVFLVICSIQWDSHYIWKDEPPLGFEDISFLWLRKMFYTFLGMLAIVMVFVAIVTIRAMTHRTPGPAGLRRLH